MYGDWNDALDGLGVSEDKSRDYGDGVSVMATLQLYKNLLEMCDIFEKVGKYTEKTQTYMQYRERIRVGLQKHAIVENSVGERKIVHGWGDKIRYKIASYCDNDGYSRDSVTVNAYWILAGLHKEYPEILPEIMNAYERLEGKYGIKTFLPAFAPSNDKVGRITHLPEGTAENGATYNHSTNFAIWSLFEIGEDKLAWETMYKVLPVTHSFITTTPFVMPNSYIYNEERGFDGESMNDWFSGSGSVLVKLLFGGVFGVRPALDNLTIKPSSYMPCKAAEITLPIKGAMVRVAYKKEGNGARKYLVNGVEQVATEEKCIVIDNANLKGEITVEIID
jgi:cellobiose phosphorylase